MRKYILSFFCACTIGGYAQNRIADSLRQLILQSKEDTSKLKLLKQLGHAFLYSNPDSCYYYTNKELQLAQKLHDQKEETFCLSLMGATISYIGNYPKALEISLGVGSSVLDMIYCQAIMLDRAGMCSEFPPAHFGNFPGSKPGNLNKTRKNGSFCHTNMYVRRLI
jgi:hypothetical protein